MLKFKFPFSQYRVFLLAVCLFVPAGSDFAQFYSNLQAFSNLVDSSAMRLVKENNLAGRKIAVVKSLPPAYSYFGNQLAASISKYSGVPLSDTSNAAQVEYNIEEAKVSYGEMYRDGLFGSYNIEREILLKGNYLVNSSGHNVKTFQLAFSDTLKYDDIRNCENPAYPFTQGEIPAEPFWSSLLEPAVAVGSAAAAIYLFFSVRSK
jgi:hypothetical protein